MANGNSGNSPLLKTTPSSPNYGKELATWIGMFMSISAVVFASGVMWARVNAHTSDNNVHSTLAQRNTETHAAITSELRPIEIQLQEINRRLSKIEQHIQK